MPETKKEEKEKKSGQPTRIKTRKVSWAQPLTHSIVDQSKRRAIRER